MLDPRTFATGLADQKSGDTERWARMTPEQRLEVFAQLCELCESIVRGRPDAQRLRATPERSAEAEALWARLVREARDARARR